MNDLCGENYEIQCGEVFLHLMNGRLTFHCTLCECKYNSYQNYATHVASEHSPSVEWDEEAVKGEEVCVDEILDDDVANANDAAGINIVKEEEIPVKDEQESFNFDENSFNSFADEYEQDELEYLDELEVEPDDLKQEVFVETQPNRQTRKKAGRKPKPEPVSIPSDDARPVKIKYINKDDERKFRCPNCDFSCKLKRNLKGHLRRHAKDKPFKCTFCAKAFYTTTEQKVHLRTHTGEKPYSCGECGEKFITFAKLNEHRKAHDPACQNYQCEACGKVFASANRLRNHANIHERGKKYSCTKCDLSFRRYLDLKNHFQKHQFKDIYECVICDEVFHEKQSLDYHVESAHMSVYI